MRPLTIKRLLWTCGGLAALLLASVVLALKLGAVPISVTDLILDLGRIAIGRADELPTEYRLIVFDLRLPRILLGTPGGVRMTLSGGRIRWLLVGASLAGGLLIALLTVHLAAPWDARLIGH